MLYDVITYFRLSNKIHNVGSRLREAVKAVQRFKENQAMISLKYSFELLTKKNDL